MVKVKVCGMTRVMDAALACELGASALGFVFWPHSPRYIVPSEARAIVETLGPEVLPIGVFVDASVAQIEDTVQQAGLRGVQLHGDESVALCERLAERTELSVLKAVALRGPDSVERAVRLPEAVMVLLDVHDPIRRGGTGRRVDWTLAGSVAQRRRVFLAGGLTPANVTEAVERVRPYGVDVSSGLEASPGVKDPALVRRFFAALAGAVPRSHDRAHG